LNISIENSALVHYILPKYRVEAGRVQFFENAIYLGLTWILFYSISAGLDPIADDEFSYQSGLYSRTLGNSSTWPGRFSCESFADNSSSVGAGGHLEIVQLLMKILV
jgi:hypothetical protein